MEEMCKSPEFIEGEYKLIIRGRKIYLRKVNGYGATSKTKVCCHKCDKFNAMFGIRLALWKMMWKLHERMVEEDERG